MANVRLGRNEVEKGRLPMICMRCGMEASIKRKKKFQWYPPWVNILFLIGLLPAAIVAMILTKRMTIQAPLCYEHRSHWSGRTLIILLSMLGVGVMAIGGLVLVVNRDGQGRQNDPVGGIVCLGTAVLGIGWIVLVAILQGTAIRPKEITDKSITLKGVNETFVDALQEFREQRITEKEGRAGLPKRLPAPDEDDADDDDDD